MAAILEVVTTVQNALIAGGITRVFIDRDETNPVTEAEMPCVNLTWTGAEITTENHCQDSYFWRGQITLDCWATVVLGTPVFNGCDALVAQVASVFGADFTFGGKFTEATIIAVGGFETINEQTGTFGMTVAVNYQTSKSDWSTISS